MSQFAKLLRPATDEAFREAETALRKLAEVTAETDAAMGERGSLKKFAGDASSGADRVRSFGEMLALLKSIHGQIEAIAAAPVAHVTKQFLEGLEGVHNGAQHTNLDISAAIADLEKRL
jgi:hypothetical protein